MAGRPRDSRLDVAIRAAADELLCSGGYTRFTMERVAERSKIPRSTLYARWRNKTDLAAAIVVTSITAVAPAATFEDALLAAFDADLRHARSPYGAACALIILETLDMRTPPQKALDVAMQTHLAEFRSLITSAGLGTQSRFDELGRILAEIRAAPLVEQFGTTIDAGHLVRRLVEA